MSAQKRIDPKSSMYHASALHLSPLTLLKCYIYGLFLSCIFQFGYFETSYRALDISNIYINILVRAFIYFTMT